MLSSEKIEHPSWRRLQHLLALGNSGPAVSLGELLRNRRPRPASELREKVTLTLPAAVRWELRQRAREEDVSPSLLAGELLRAALAAMPTQQELRKRRRQRHRLRAMMALTGIGLAISLFGSAFGQSGGWSQQDLDAIAGHSRTLRDAAQGDAALQGVLRGGEQAARQAPPGTAAAAPQPAETRPLLLFVSTSMGEAGIRDALAAASEDGAVTVVWRGFQPGEKLRDAVTRMAGLMRGLQPAPTQTVDPPAFGRHKVVAVPALVDPQTGGQLRGTTNIASMRLRLAQEEARPTPRPLDDALGPTTEVAETDLVEEIKTQLAGLDLREEMRRSADQWWRRQTFTELPPAPRSRIRHFDPTIYLQGDMPGPGGSILAPAGMRLNPLERVPFRSVVVVFDPRDARQVAWARRQREAGKPVILMATAMERGAGWDEHARLVETVGQRVFLLPPVLRDRMGIEFTPSRVEAEGSRLRIEEVMAAELPRAEEVRNVR